jgi:hypothetical protein
MGNASVKGVKIFPLFLEVRPGAAQVTPTVLSGIS